MYGKLRSQDTQCQYALVETDKVQTAKNVTSFYLRITTKCHAHLQTLTETPANFQKDPGKIVGGGGFTRYRV